MDVLETYPRDELFQTPIDELAADRRGGAAHPRSAASCGCSSAATPTAATCPAWSTCRATATPPRCASGSRRSCKRAARRRLASSTPPGSASRCWPGCTSWSGPSPGEPIGDVRRRRRSSASWPRRPGPGATTSSPPCTPSTARRTAPCWPASTPTRSPRPTRRTTRRAPAPVDLGRLEGIAGDERHRPVLLPADRRRPAARPRLKIFRIGSPLSLSEVLPILSSLGVEVVDERPYELDGLERRRRYIYDFGLRYRRRRCPTARARAVPGRLRRVVGGRQRESTASTRWCWPPGSTWRQATVLRAYAKYMRQGGTPFARTTSRTRCAATSTSPAAGRRCSRPASTRAATATSPPTARRAAERPSSRSGSSARSTTWPASTTTGSCAPT